ncbi:metal/formaldehyde-sensitive transcriptional repressor [Erwinia billingiae]|uniref:metal/formaldehyde-sensitive transcriptional repressor n=1 Tax=Erwinia billingiae TaxID=182337 RepID=UPI000D00F6E7|nr:metal/formaldehyde-sensitive transcriptional repressor [Erwinia billingiae]PRB60289.1 regulator [Erwinia billingiae]
MPHSPEDKKRALNRIKRIQGQCESIQRSLEAGVDCAPVLMQMAAVRGAMNGLMAEVLESYIKEEFSGKLTSVSGSEDEIGELVKLVRSYFK